MLIVGYSMSTRIIRYILLLSTNIYHLDVVKSSRQCATSETEYTLILFNALLIIRVSIPTCHNHDHPFLP